MMRVVVGVMAGILFVSTGGAQTNPLAESKRFVRGTGTNPSYQSFIIPLNFEKGIQLDPMGNNAAKFGNKPANQLPWFTRIGKDTNPDPNVNPLRTTYHISVNNGVATYPLQCENPLVAFGSQGGGTPLHVGQTYKFGSYFGGQVLNINDFVILGYKKDRFDGGSMNIEPDFVASIMVPRKGTPLWDAFSANGYKLERGISISYEEGGTTYITNVLDTTIELIPAVSSNDQWGVRPESPLVITHKANSDKYVYVILYAGATAVGNNLDSWMAISNPNDSSAGWYSMGYTLDFETQPAWRSTMIHSPQFNGEPMPPLYDGKSIEELLQVKTPVSFTPSLSPSAAQTLDQSPELRRHPILDRFVADMGNDPIALANYVHNEISVTDPISYNEHGDVSDKSINLGGVSRSALATLQEGQGSPMEQCALLVYLLRQAGYAAVYMEPETNKLQMLDQAMSRILRMQVRGAVNPLGQTYAPTDPNLPHLIPVNYPWVAFYLPTESRWVHLFPWIKDTEIIEGKNLYDYFPAAYNSGLKWTKQYLYGDTALIPAGTTDNTLTNLFPKFIEKTLKDNFPTLSIDDLGVKVRDRRHYRLTWGDFPTPFKLEGTPTTLESLSVRPNIFDTVNIEIFSDANPSKKVTTGDLRMVDLHNRKLLVRHEKTGSNLHNLILSLAAYRSDASGQGSFNGSDPNLLKKQVATVGFDSSDDSLTVRFKQKRHLTLPSNFTQPDYWTPYLGVSSLLEFSTDRPLRKGDLAALCIDYGRVTSKMLAVHAEEFWQMERTLNDNPTATIDPDISQGTSAYLMGMSYYEKVTRFTELAQNLHKTRILSYSAFGLSKIAPRRVSGLLPNNGDIELSQANVDMFFNAAAFASNATLHPDSGEALYLGIGDFLPVVITETSAQEHQIINTYYKESAAISTVKLLQIAKQAGTPGIIALNKSNYVTEGNKTYTVDGQTKALKDWDPGMWTSVEGAFTQPMGDYNLVYMTPGPVSSETGSYKGMGAMVYGRNQLSALIGGNSSPLNGGYGSSFSNLYYSPPVLPYTSLDYNPFGGYSVSYSNPTPAAPILAPFSLSSTSWDSVINTASSNSYAYTSTQNSWSNSASAVFNPTPPPTPSFSSLLTSVINSGSHYFGVALDNAQMAITQGTSFLKYTAEVFGDPVNVLTGDFYVDHVDLKLTGLMPLEIRRNYTSRNLADNEFGTGWKMNYASFLSFNSDESLIYAADPEGSVIGYRRQSDPNLWIPTIADNPRYTNLNHERVAANTLNGKIVKSTSGSDTLYTLTSPDGMQRIFKVRSFPISGQNRSRPYLDQWLDPQGNSYTFTYGIDVAATDYGKVRQIKSSNGTFVGFYYDTFGHITEAYTSDGRRLYYRYNAFGDLIEVTFPDASKTSYEYATETTTVNGKTETTSNHLLIREVKPDGRVLENTYDSDRRVTQQKATVGENKTLVVNATVDYSVPGRTILKDAYNRETVYEYSDGSITKVTDPLNQSIISEWYTATDVATGAYDRSLKKQTDKRGLVTEFKYDARGNLLERKITGDVTGDGVSETVTISTEYNSKDLPDLVTKPLLTQTKYFYDDSRYPYLVTGVENRINGVAVSSVSNEYVDAGSGAIFAKGLLFRQRKGIGMMGQSSTEWTYNANGYPTTQIRYTGTGDPNVVLNFTYNLRGELVEQRDSSGRKTCYAYDAMGRKVWTEAKDAAGVYVGWQYDYFNGNGEVEWSDGSRYNPEDYVWKKYDGAGRPLEEIRWRSVAKADGTGVEAPMGDDLYSTTFYKHNFFGDLVEIRDARRNSTVMTYDGIGQMLTRQSYDGYANAGGTLKATESFTYEPGGQIATQTNPLNAVTRRFYAANGKLRRQENPDGTVLEWRYDLLGRVQKEILSNGTYWETTYNDGQRTVIRSLKDAGNAILATETSVFDSRGNLLTKTDVENNLFSKAYDGLDRVRVETGPAASGQSGQQTVTHSFDGIGSVVTTSNSTGDRTVTTSDMIGRPLKSEIYKQVNTLVTQTSYSYTSDHHGSTVTAGSGTGAITSSSWTDTFGKPVLTRFANGTYRSQIYDIGGLLLSSRDELGQVTSATYDGLGRKVSEKLPDGATTNFIYDSVGNLLQRQMPASLTQVMTYDSIGRKSSEELRAGAQVSRHYGYAYYASGADQGRLQTVTDPRGIQHTKLYDSFGRVQTITSAGVANASTGYTYDRRGLPLQVSQSSDLSPNTAVNRTYNAYGQIDSESVTVGAAVISSVTQSWNDAGRRSQLASSGKSFGFFYQGDGALTQVTFNGQNYNASYEDNGLLATRTNPYRSWQVGTRDNRGRITNQSVTVGGSTPLVEDITWRDNSTVNTYAVQRGGLYNENRGYSYNSRGQVTSESFAPAAAQSASFTYDFDFGAGTLGVRTKAFLTGLTYGNWEVPSGQVNGFGRILQESILGGKRPVPMNGVALGAKTVTVSLDGTSVEPVTFAGPQGDGSWSAQSEVPAGSHLLDVKATHPSGYVSTQGSQFNVAPVQETSQLDYDSEGNVTQRSWSGGRVQILTWNALDRLIKVTERNAMNNGFDWTAVYDGLGRRVHTTYTPVTNNVAGTANTVKSYFDPQVEFLEIAVEVAGQKYWKVHGPDLNGIYGGLNGIGGLEAVVKDSDSSTVGVVNDFYGNIIACVNSVPSVAWNPTKVGGYGPLPGSTSVVLESLTSSPTSATVANAYAWRSRHIDGTGLTNLGARHYEATSGRFLSPDPLGHGSSMSLYDYASGDPVNRLDADGRYAKQRWNEEKENAHTGMQDAWLGIHYAGNTVNSLMTFGEASTPASDRNVTANQLYHQWFWGTGPDKRSFDENSVMGQDMLRADYVQTAAREAAVRAMAGESSSVFVGRAVGDTNPIVYFAYDFPVDAFVTNPARAFQGSVNDGTAKAQPDKIMYGTGVAYVPVNIHFIDNMTSESGTRNPPPIGYGGSEWKAAFPGENPYGKNGPLRTIQIEYNLNILVPIYIEAQD